MEWGRIIEKALGFTIALFFVLIIGGAAIMIYNSFRLTSEAIERQHAAMSAETPGEIKARLIRRFHKVELTPAEAEVAQLTFPVYDIRLDLTDSTIILDTKKGLKRLDNGKRSGQN